MRPSSLAFIQSMFLYGCLAMMTAATQNGGKLQGKHVAILVANGFEQSWNLLTSRKPADIPVINREMIQVFAHGASR
jgi:hypothetical protein